MAVLTNLARATLHAEIMREALGDISINKTQLRAVVDALDDYFNANAAAMNTAIPQPQRGSLTTSQKARIAAAVLLRRYVDGV